MAQKAKNEREKGREAAPGGRERGNKKKRGEGPYLNDIVAGVHTRRLPLIAPLKRPCYPAGGATEREDPQDHVHHVRARTHTHRRRSILQRARTAGTRTKRAVAGKRACTREAKFDRG